MVLTVFKMTSRLGLRLALCSFLLVVWLATPSAFAAQSRSWRIGVGGGWATGFTGVLALYGLPNEHILDREMGSPSDLQKFDMVLLSYPTCGIAQMNSAVEEYVRNGGIAIYETPCTPSVAMIPGRRIPAQKGPNTVYTSDTPVTSGLTSLVLPTQQQYATSIIPSDPNVKVLARFTDNGARADVQGRFVDGSQGSPAIIMADYGKGKVVWSGFSISTWAALYGRQYVEPFIVKLLSELSDGQVTPRFTTQMEGVDNLITEPRPYRVNLQRRVPKGTAAMPAKAEVLEGNADSVDEFDLYGKLAPGVEATAYVAYFNAKWNRAVRFAKNAVSIVNVNDGRDTVLRSAALPAAKAPRDIVIKRRWGAVAVYVDGVPLVSACDGAPLLGVVADAGITDAGYQPVGKVYFADDFMRTAKEANPWETVTGAWHLVQTEGQPSMGANPFRYEGVADTAGITTTGQWFWDDYSMEMSVFPEGAACGAIAHYQDQDHFILIRLSSPADGKGKLSIIRRTKTGDVELASAPVVCERQRWYKLGLRVTSGTIEALLDRKVVVSAPDSQLGNGSVGMYVEGGKAQFDDVVVSSWRGTPCPASGCGPWEWAVEGSGSAAGRWGFSPKAGTSGAVTASASDGARALSPYNAYEDGTFAADIKPAAHSETGLFVRYQGHEDFVLASLARDKSGKLFALLRARMNGRDQALGSAAVSGDASDWHRLVVETVGHTLALQVDGKPCLSAEAPVAERGAVGLQVRGSGAFRDWSFVPGPSGEDVNDTPTPPYAGIIDKNSWAGRAGAWHADPANLDTFWHMGYFPHDVDFRLGVYRNSAPTTSAKVMLSSGRAVGTGYLLTTTHDWSQSAIRVELAREGKTVASCPVSLASGADRYCVSLRREGGLYTASVDDRDVFAFQDPAPLSATSLRFQLLGGGLVHPHDTRVSSPDLRNYTFDSAPTDWFINSGTWDIASRWSCTPGWTWFSGVSTGDALIRTKAKYAGDQNVQFYAGAKMMPTANGGYWEAMRDIIVGLCGSEDPAKGYRFTIQSSAGGTYLTKDGAVVAQADRFALTQIAIHNDWTHFSAAKEGNKLSLKWWGRTILEYVDPTPLEGGYVWLGTVNNGIMIPRVTIYGRQAG